MGILEHQGRGAISQNAVPESTIRAAIGSVNTSALLAIYFRECDATTNFPERDFWPGITSGYALIHAQSTGTPLSNFE
jgi:hypothetical protein